MRLKTPGVEEHIAVSNSELRAYKMRRARRAYLAAPFTQTTTTDVASSHVNSRHIRRILNMHGNLECSSSLERAAPSNTGAISRSGPASRTVLCDVCVQKPATCAHHQHTLGYTWDAWKIRATHRKSVRVCVRVVDKRKRHYKTHEVIPSLRQ